MGWQAVLASGITATAGIGGNILANRYAKKQLAAQNAYNREMWELDNEYNSPANQMERLREAGLNPHLVYGNGTVANTSRGPVRSDDYLKVPSPTGDLGGIAANSIASYQDIKMREAQTDNIKAQTDNINARTLTESFRTGLTELQGKKTYEETRQMEGLWNFNVQAKEAEARKAEISVDQALQQLVLMKADELQRNLNARYLEKQISQQDIEREIKSADLLYKNMENDWRKMGIHSGDHPAIRSIVRMMAEQGIKSYDELLKYVRNLFR